MRTTFEVEEGIGKTELKIIQTRRNQKLELLKKGLSRKEVFGNYNIATAVQHEYSVQERADELAHRLNFYKKY